jgi:hypothetical protein
MVYPGLSNQCLQVLVNSPRRHFALLDRVDNLSAHADAIATGKQACDAGSSGLGIHQKLALFEAEPLNASQLIQQRSLTQSLDGHIARDNELTVDYGLQGSGAALVGLLVKAMKPDP